MIDRINTQVAVSVDKATKRAADALERVTDRIAGVPDNAVDRGVTVRLNAQYSENYLKARNAQDSISYLQTREGALGSVTEMLQRLRDLAVSMGNPILNESDKGLIRQEAGMIMSDIDSFASGSEFNGHKMLEDINTSSLGLSGLNFGEEGTISAIDSAISAVSSKRVESGARINAMEARIDNLANANINLAEAIEARSGSLTEDIIELADSVNKALVTVKAADLVLDVDKAKLKGLLEML